MRAPSRESDVGDAIEKARRDASPGIARLMYWPAWKSIGRSSYSVRPSVGSLLN